MRKTLAIDFDGVIHAYTSGFGDGELYDPPVEDALYALSKLERDYTIVIYTTRVSDDHSAKFHGKTGEEAIREWLDFWCKQYNITLAFRYVITATKPPAIAYIDDRAVRFTNWTDIRKMFQ